MTDQQDLFGWNGQPPSKTRADQIEAAFRDYHRANPDVWVLLKQFSFLAMKHGFEHYSISAVIERIRWHVNMETRSEDGLKIRNDFRAYYARMFHVAHPEHDGFFHTRKRPSTEHPETPGDPPPNIDPPELPDNNLNQRLRNLLDETDKQT